jgi:hypothetical protein
MSMCSLPPLVEGGACTLVVWATVGSPLRAWRLENISAWHYMQVEVSSKKVQTDIEPKDDFRLPVHTLCTQAPPSEAHSDVCHVCFVLPGQQGTWHLKILGA